MGTLVVRHCITSQLPPTQRWRIERSLFVHSIIHESVIYSLYIGGVFLKQVGLLMFKLCFFKNGIRPLFWLRKNNITCLTKQCLFVWYSGWVLQWLSFLGMFKSQNQTNIFSHFNNVHRQVCFMPFLTYLKIGSIYTTTVL